MSQERVELHDKGLRETHQCALSVIVPCFDEVTVIETTHARLAETLTEQTDVIDTQAAGSDITGGHGGGDRGIMDCFVKAVAAGDPSLVLSGPAETLESHLTVFAAERARRENRVVEVSV